MALRIDINANARQAQREVKDLSGALDDTADALDDLAREGDRAGDKIERTFRDMVRDAEKVDRAVADVGDKGSANMRKLGDAGEEVSGELKQNLGETFSSFRGDLEDLPQIAQDVFGGLASSMGSIPAAAGLAAGAAGIGLIIQAVTNLKEQEEARKDRVTEWAQAYIDAGGSITDSIASLAAVEAIYTDTEKYEKASQAAKDWGVDVSTAVNAMAGDATALAVAQESLTKRQDALNKAMETTQVNADGTADGLADVHAEVTRGQEAIDNLTGEMADGATRAAEYATSLYNLATNTGTATGEVDDLGNAIVRLPDETEVVVNAQTGQAYENVDAFEQKVNGVDGQSATVTARFTADTSEVDRQLRRLNDTTLKIGTRFVTGEMEWQ